MKDAREFLAVAAGPWHDGPIPGTAERILSRDPADPDVLTRLVRWAPGFSTLEGVIRHEWAEEVYVLEGDLSDVTLDQTFGTGYFASRPPGMPHGPYRTEQGCVMLEVRYRA
ncbi:cupin domain-containing protein [Streptacidiphilus jiangxiensis]|uniref:ChrR Cupin-like domain-containing protein n=1 Tax=Streptacidiphilus jiangxiensis TaxID=235985 RepID=A0A1H7TKT0_STRJI|nr:cupin domain-containing protein [Streptacidiphilus jiangxiensis]SEL85411.1 ChrR Cupin-like domain-containing protein [Streptacidiphilus jiangxiensis]